MIPRATTLQFIDAQSLSTLEFYEEVYDGGTDFHLRDACKFAEAYASHCLRQREQELREAREQIKEISEYTVHDSGGFHAEGRYVAI